MTTTTDRWIRLPAAVDAPDMAAAEAAASEKDEVPRGWTAVTVGHDPVTFRFTGSGEIGEVTAAALRIPIGSDCRAQYLLDVTLVADGTRLGTIDLRYAHAFELFAVDIPLAALDSVLSEGVRLAVASGEPFLMLTGRVDEVVTACQPHLLLSNGSGDWSQLVSTVCSLDSLQPFGWLEGCVLEGIAAVTDEVTALDEHLAEYIHDGVLDHVDLHGVRRIDEVGTIEALLPFATLVPRPGGQKWAQLTLDTVGARDGQNLDSIMITAEGMYTIAHPLAVTGAHSGSREVIDRAIAEADLRIDILADADGLTPRTKPCGWGGMYRNWARGHAWYLLGLAKVIRTLRGVELDLTDDLARLEAAWTQMATWLLGHQAADGLWACYVDEPVTGAETSGSAGIAAALAIGTQLGLVDARTAVAAALDGLEPHIDPDGILGGVSQHNAGGEGLQRFGYRVRSQMGMGLAAQAYGEFHAG